MKPLSRAFSGTWSATAVAAVLLLVAAFALGGASRENELRLAVVELAALPLLVLVGARMFKSELQVSRGLGLGCVLLLVGIPLLQLLPLPPGVWTSLPGRDQLLLALNVVGLPTGWSPLSLTPDKTWRSLLALIPVVTMFYAAQALNHEQRQALFQIVVGAAILFILVGVAQLASGGNRLYPWRTTDWPSVVGLFANRNHLASLCLSAIPLTVALGARQYRRKRNSQAALWTTAVLVAFLVLALGAIRSRVGIGLAIPTLAASLALGWVAIGRSGPKLPLLLVGGAGILAVTAVGLFALQPILDRFDPSQTEGRFENWPIILNAASDYLPWGAGIGAFDPVFRSVEPWQSLRPTFFNQAHNEYLEIWLEAGWVGIAGVILFLVWFTRRAWTAWRGRAASEKDLQRASTIVIGILLLHSVVDYPLRTLTLAVVFALCCATLELTSRKAAISSPD